MLERLDYIKLDPGRILDAGAGSGPQSARLLQRYRTAQLVSLDFSTATRALWPQTLVGLFLFAWLWQAAPGAVWFWTPLVIGLVGAIPIAMISAHPLLGRALARAGICRIPEEVHLPAGQQSVAVFPSFMAIRRQSVE